MNDDDILGGTNTGDMSIDTTYSEEGRHIIESHTQNYEESVPPELLSKVPYVSQLCDLTQKYQVDPLDKSKDSNMLSKINNMTHTKDINLSSQENQDYFNQYDQQFIACKHDGGQIYYNQIDQQFIAHKHNDGLKRVTIELVFNVVLEEEENYFCQ